jgi:hypothetical protein
MCVKRLIEVVITVGDDDCLHHAINDALHAMMRMCKAQYNDVYKIVQFSENVDEELL